MAQSGDNRTGGESPDESRERKRRLAFIKVKSFVCNWLPGPEVTTSDKFGHPFSSVVFYSILCKSILPICEKYNYICILSIAHFPGRNSKMD